MEIPVRSFSWSRRGFLKAAVAGRAAAGAAAAGPGIQARMQAWIFMHSPLERGPDARCITGADIVVDCGLTVKCY